MKLTDTALFRQEAYINGQWVAAWHLVSAGSILAALPPVAMFFLMQKHFIAGLTLGAVK